MSRHTQDIPIRPRYGIDELVENESASAVPIKTRKTSTSEKMASSYSEIPFLAQYPGAVPDYALNDVTPTETKNVMDREESIEDESGDDDDNSKGSSCGDNNKNPKRPNSLQCDSSVPYELESSTSTEEKMRHFVADDLEEKLRISSPTNKDQYGFTSSRNSTPSASGPLTRHYLQTQVPQIDANVLNDIEIEAQYLAASVDNLTENLCNLLHSISAITADNIDVHKNAVNKLTDSMDANIKCMYTIMAKTEEITKSMKPTEQLGQRIREIKRLVDMLDNIM
ncbi:BLOC-1-related complex subunit 6 [Teleopsis dalmanni]|uniref:BLOC-1-related complex subunit 6 n=1 Tax=Teleopsis dalmanni TaxID=139649 RepID=UPI0018CF6BA4|nr:BLOC-1-related complex subunit 6 [Teleopsis dalmanni]